jgi:hypothetical protein
MISAIYCGDIAGESSAFIQVHGGDSSVRLTVPLQIIAEAAALVLRIEYATSHA